MRAPRRSQCRLEPEAEGMVRAVRIEHVAVWVRDLERMRAFYVEQLGGTSGAGYHNPRTGFRSYFISFAEGARIELMSGVDGSGGGPAAAVAGYAHVALSFGSREAVDALVRDLEQAGVVIAGRPRTTGDGYYEAVIQDPEGNRIELTT
jgi:lactoylglutathione lyase